MPWRRLPPDQQAGVLAEALAAAQAIGNEWWRADALSAVAERLPPDQPAVLAEALAGGAGDPGRMAAGPRPACRGGAAAARSARRVLAEALAAARAIEDAGSRAYALSAVAARLPPDQPALLAEALAAAQAIEENGSGPTP